MQNIYHINGMEYWIDEFEPGWLWMSNDAESDIYYPTHNEALQAAMEYVLEQEANDLAEKQEAIDDRLYGTYDDQVRSLYNSLVR